MRHFFLTFANTVDSTYSDHSVSSVLWCSMQFVDCFADWLHALKARPLDSENSRADCRHHASLVCTSALLLPSRIPIVGTLPGVLALFQLLALSLTV